MASCKSCGAEIVWAVNELSGKRVPLSVATKEKRYQVLDGAGNARLIETYLTHFSDCPDAAQQRRPKDG